MKRFVFLALVLASCCASAQVTKCTLPNGKVTYGDGPCPTGALDSRVNTTANVLDGSGDRAAAARMRNDSQPIEEASSTPGASGRNLASSPPADEQACRAARRDLDMASSRMRTEVSRGNHPGKFGVAVKDAEYRVDAACGTNMAGARAADSARRREARANTPRFITNCNESVCFDNLGGIYNKGAGNTVFGTTGEICQNVPGSLQCSGGRN